MKREGIKKVENGGKFECYSRKLFGFLTMKGFRYERRFVHGITGNTCWVYIVNDELSDALTQWHSEKPNK